jgi:membrane fusion protein (multidrug efflux system)
MEQADNVLPNVDKNKGNFTFFRVIILILAPLILILIAIYFYIINIRYVSTDDAYIKIGISSISPQISGIVKEIKVKNTQNVKKDDIILTIDKTAFNINLELAKANLASAVNQIKSLKAGYQAKLASLEAAKADLIYYQKQYDRTKELRISNSISQADLDGAKRQLDNALQTINNIEETAKQQLASLDGEAELETDKYSLFLQAKANLDKANLDLAYTIIHAPFDGDIANLYTKEGSFVSQGSPLASVIDHNDIWVEANFKETELTNIKPGQHATITIDSFPGNEISAKVIGIVGATGSEFSILPAQNSSGNWVKVIQRINVRLELLDKQELPLSSGMSVTVTVDTKSS